MTRFQRPLPALQAAPVRPGRVLADGHETYYLEAGGGPPLLFLPPSAYLLARSYHEVWGRLAASHHVYVPEQPGTGHSARLPAAMTFEDAARWAAAFLAEVGVSCATVIGHSTGGGVALVFAALYPERVERLVLVDTVGEAQGRSPLAIVAARVRDARLEMPLNRRGWPDPLLNLLRHGGAFLDSIRHSTSVDLTAYAPRVQAPTLLAWGARDHTFPLGAARALQQRVPDAALHVSETGSHDWLLLQPEAFCRAIEAWCEGSLPARVAPAGGRADPRGRASLEHDDQAHAPRQRDC